MSLSPKAPWRAATLLLYGLSAGLGLVATIGSFDRGLDIALIVWTFGMIAGFAATAMAVMAAFAFTRQDDDGTDLRSFVGVVMFLVSSPATTGGSGVMAAVVLSVAWLMGRLVRRWHRREWRAEFIGRRAMLHRLGKRDPRTDPEAVRYLAEDDARGDVAAPSTGADAGYAVTRGELKRRAREIDQDPWRGPQP